MATGLLGPPARRQVISRDSVPDRGISDVPDTGYRISEMNLEGAALICALLGGPTLVWLIYRVARGPVSRSAASFVDDSVRPALSQPPLEAALRHEFWICKDCRSANHQGAKRCYGCGIEPAPVEPMTSAPVTGDGWVPVMHATPDIYVAEPVAAMMRATSKAGAPDLDLSPPEPVSVPAAATAASAERATRRPRSTRRSAGASAAAAAADASVYAHAAGATVDVVEVDGSPDHDARPSAPSGTPAVCPYLRFKDDPATRCDYPDARNVCHAASASGGATLPTLRRLVRGVRARTLPISPDFQATTCLTADYERCARYPAAAGLARPS